MRVHFLFLNDILGEIVDILIDMDIIPKGAFAITNYNGKTVFTFRYPSLECINFVKTSYKKKPSTVTNK